MPIQNPEVSNVEKLLTGDIQITVPKYQRSYSWERDQIEEFWEDVLAALSSRATEYFLGTIVLQAKSDGALEVIDGQQRLTTLSALFSAIRHYYLTIDDESRAERLYSRYLAAEDFEKGAVPHPKLQLNEINNPVYVGEILPCKDREEINKLLKEKSTATSNKRLLEAYAFFLEHLAEEVGRRGKKADDFITSLLTCLGKTVRVLKIPVASDEDANIFFESLNARGKELAISDLLKNRFYHEAKNQVTLAQNLWSQMEKHLGRTSTPEFLRHFWIAKKVDTKDTNVREKTLYRTVVQEIRGQENATLRILRELSKSASAYAKITDVTLWPNGSPFESDFIQSLEDLKRFRVTQMSPVLLNAIETFRNDKDIANAFRIVSNFAFRYFVVGSQSPGNLERESGNIALEIRKGTIKNAKQLSQAFLALNPDKVFHSAFSTFSVGQRPAHARYILGRLNDQIAKSSSRSGGELVANLNAREVTLEHVFPENAGATWKAELVDKSEAKALVQRLGNLTLLRGKINRDIGDKSFEEKKKLAFKPSKLEINKYIAAASKWAEREVEERQRQLADVSLQVWPLA